MQIDSSRKYLSPPYLFGFHTFFSAIEFKTYVIISDSGQVIERLWICVSTELSV